MGKLGFLMVPVLAAALAGCDDKTEYPDAAVPDAALHDAAADVAADQMPLDTVPGKYCKVVETDKGPVQGKRQDKSCAFLGIPYAKPPVGPLRWEHAEPPDAWTKVLVADTYGNACPQNDPLGNWGAQGEDCLTINVWTPEPKPASPAAVLVWINKGIYFDWGSAQSPWTDGTRLAEDQGLVVVTFNWRIGALGFLAHPALGTASGNYGFADQIRALQWVRDNIAVFGGDPKRVTIWGGGYHGAESVCTHMVSEKSKGLFHGGIMESGHCPRTWQKISYKEVLTQAEAEAQGQELAKAVVCDTGNASDIAACLRSKKPDEIWTKFPTMDWWIGTDKGMAIWGPILDGVYLKGIPADLVKAGQVQSKVPLILGSNKDEGTYYSPSTDPAAWTSMVNKLWGANAPQVLAQYSPNDYAQRPGCAETPAAWAAADCLGDAAFRCPYRRTARALSAQGVLVFLYHFTLPISYCVPPFCPNTCEATGWSTFKVLAFHTPLEQPTMGWGQWKFSADEEKMSSAVRGYWKRFAETGDPNDTSGGAAAWPKYDETTDQHLDLGKTIQAKSGLKKAKCDFWDIQTP